jgi:hypothetical protein
MSSTRVPAGKEQLRRLRDFQWLVPQISAEEDRYDDDNAEGTDNGIDGCDRQGYGGQDGLGWPFGTTLNDFLLGQWPKETRTITEFLGSIAYLGDCEREFRNNGRSGGSEVYDLV